jgi:SanA protein
LKDRADLAIQLYRAGKAKKLLISGDNGSKSHNEITPIYKYLKKFQIPERDIFVDFAGFDTQDSMYRARHNFEIETIIIPTQSRFINRSVFLALKYGMKPQGIITLYDYQPYLFFGWHAREDLAVVKAVLETFFERPAKIASNDVYPISGTGNSVLYFSK